MSFYFPEDQQRRSRELHAAQERYETERGEPDDMRKVYTSHQTG